MRVVSAGVGRIVLQLAFSIFAFASASSFAAEVPTLDAFYPAGAERGSRSSVIAFGKFDPWPPKVWVSNDALTFTAETNKGKFSVTIAADATPGTRLVRLFND